ncbi:hypothetical protein [uncultured Mailhella sp.]|uniref:hypothetical protein n=1 Tax=uncultured Mailhella sp. TaxID=1981031 RepID=UPI00320ADE15
MKEYDVTFAAAVEALEGARSCRVLRLADEASSVLLLSLEGECPPLLLGCPARLLSDFSSGVTRAEREELGLSPEGGEADVEVFCRMGIPGNDPLAAGLDCSRLVLVSPSTGRALEASRAQGGIIPLRRAAASSARSRSDD